MSRKSDVVLDRSHIMVMLQDPLFYESVPDFAHLKSSSEWAVYAAENGLKAGACEICRDLGQHFRPIVTAFMLKIADMVKAQDSGLQAIRTYLTQKKQYDVGQVVIYYRGKSAGNMQRITF